MAVNKIFIPTFISSVTYAPARVLPHIYFYNGLKACEPYFIQGYVNGNTGSVVSHEQNAFPYFDNYEGQDPTSGSRSLLFFNEPAVYGTTPTGSLYTEYWADYISLLYNPRTRLVNCEAIIPLADYFKMELNDIVEWRNNYYHLRAMNDYNLSNGEVKLQLLGPILPDSIRIPLQPPTTTTTTTTTPPPECLCYVISNPTGAGLNATWRECGGSLVEALLSPGTNLRRCSEIVPTGDTGIVVTACIDITNCNDDADCTGCSGTTTTTTSTTSTTTTTSTTSTTTTTSTTSTTTTTSTTSTTTTTTTTAPPEECVRIQVTPSIEEEFLDCGIYNLYNEYTASYYLNCTASNAPQDINVYFTASASGPGDDIIYTLIIPSGSHQGFENVYTRIWTGENCQNRQSETYTITIGPIDPTYPTCSCVTYSG